MKRIGNYQLIAVFTLIAGWLAVPSAANAASIKWNNNVRQAWDTAKSQRQPLLIYLHSEGCIYCRKLERETFQDANLAADLQRFVAASVTAEDEPRLVKFLKVRGFPTIVLVRQNGEVVDVITGFVTAKELRSRLQSVGSSRR